MLEQRVLLIHRRTASAVQPIVEGDSGAALGFARWRTSSSRWWGALFGQPVLAVHEHEDEPLLFTIHRAWTLLPRRDVRDADGRHVGLLLRHAIQDRYGRTIATWHDDVFRNAHQRVLAETKEVPEGVRLSFHEEIAGEPFLKMLLLAAVLSHSRD